MPIPQTYEFTRYLAAKKSVDDRALNLHVWQTLAREIKKKPAPVCALEVGAGIGTMIERTLDWGLFTEVDYEAIDALPGNIECAFKRLSQWAGRQGYSVNPVNQEKLILRGGDRGASIRLAAIDLFDFIAREQNTRKWDVLIAHAFLDLMDVPLTLPPLFQILKPGGLFYFTLTFDGATILEPVIDPELDELVDRLYHRTMDRRLTRGKPSGDSRAGRHLFEHLKNTGVQVLDAGASDWVVFAAQGAYPQDEAYFLHFIIHTIQEALARQPELEAGAFADWIAKRHAQVESGELVFIAHQLDFVGRVKV
jgi:SAM-dependent methyltransferase